MANNHGRPDVTIAIVDDGIAWRSTSGQYTSLIPKVRLNSGELPEPQPLTPAIDPAHPYDKNYDGVFNINDYCSKITSPWVCEDTRVTDRNGNSRIDPEDLIRTPAGLTESTPMRTVTSTTLPDGMHSKTTTIPTMMSDLAMEADALMRRRGRRVTEAESATARHACSFLCGSATLM